MKKLLALLLILSLLCALPIYAAAAGGNGRGTECGNVMLTVTGCCMTPGADGAPRLTLFLSAGNKNDTPREIHAEGCVIGPCELPVNLSLTLDAWESREASLVIPLTALSFFDLRSCDTDFVCLRLSVSEPGKPKIHAEPLSLRIGELPKIEAKNREEKELFHRFGARIVTLGANWDGLYYTAWFLLENNNDFSLNLDGRADGAIFTGCSVQPRSSRAFRIDFPADTQPAGRGFTLRCALTGQADGPEKPAVDMASFRAELAAEERAGGWTASIGSVENENSQSYIARVGMRDFQYDECRPVFETDPDAPELAARDSGLVSLACCGGYEILAGNERAEGTRAILPLTLRSFTGEALALRVEANGNTVSLPCLTGEALACPANGSAEGDFVFDAGGLAYTELAGEKNLRHGFALEVGPASEPAVSYGTHPADRTCAVGEIEALEPCDFEEVSVGALSLRLLGLDLKDGLSIWLRVKNESDEPQPLGDAHMEGMLNSSVLSFVNSGSVIPAGADCPVLLRAALVSDDGAADPFAFRLPALSELNTLKLRLGSGEDACNLTVMFQHNGNIMLASASDVNAAPPEKTEE